MCFGRLVEAVFAGRIMLFSPHHKLCRALVVFTRVPRVLRVLRVPRVPRVLRVPRVPRVLRVQSVQYRTVP